MSDSGGCTIVSELDVGSVVSSGVECSCTVSTSAWSGECCSAVTIEAVGVSPVDAAFGIEGGSSASAMSDGLFRVSRTGDGT